MHGFGKEESKEKRVGRKKQEQEVATVIVGRIHFVTVVQAFSEHTRRTSPFLPRTCAHNINGHTQQERASQAQAMAWRPSLVTPYTHMAVSRAECMCNGGG